VEPGHVADPEVLLGAFRRALRDEVVPHLAEMTNPVMRIVIARQLLGRGG
jgi:alkylation response protein AidB-like acyl-CoA dehydrogenase